MKQTPTALCSNNCLDSFDVFETICWYFPLWGHALLKYYFDIRVKICKRCTIYKLSSGRCILGCGKKYQALDTIQKRKIVLINPEMKQIWKVCFDL